MDLASERLDGDFPDDILDELRSRSRVRSFPKGAALMLEGARSGRVLLLLEGRVKVSRLTEDGREIIVSIREPRELLGDLSLLSDRPHTATVTAMEPVRALCVEGDDFLSLLKEHPRAGLALLVVQAGRLVEADMDRMELGTQDVTGRVARRLAELASRFGEKTADGIRLALPISQRELASWTGASREGVSKALQTLRHKGLIKIHRRGATILDLEALGRVAS